VLPQLRAVEAVAQLLLQPQVAEHQAVAVTGSVAEQLQAVLLWPAALQA
jgi:hypothetical protein